MTKFFYYFAYGSNLLKERIRVQIKRADMSATELLKILKLNCVAVSLVSRGGARPGICNDHRETCEQRIIPTTKGFFQVHGCVWRVPDEFAGELDLQESGYHRLNVPIQCADAIIECRTYQYSNINASPAPPSPHYKTVIVAGAIEHSLPESYVKGLKEIPDNGYKGRVAVDIDVIKHLNQ
ncbi:hypothetical protein OSTOST_12649 [Ostertagia ostertagi]